jgi:acyl carrier protein
VQTGEILGVMKAYFDEEQPPERLAHFPDVRAADLLEDSVDVITFIMHLEDKLRMNIKLAEVGPALAKMTFQELAAELCRVNGK